MNRRENSEPNRLGAAWARLDARERRLVAIAMLVKGHSVSAIARLLGAARSSVNRWRQRFLTDGLDGLRNGTTGRRRRTAFTRATSSLESKGFMT